LSQNKTIIITIIIPFRCIAFHFISIIVALLFVLRWQQEKADFLLVLVSKEREKEREGEREEREERVRSGNAKRSNQRSKSVAIFGDAEKCWRRTPRRAAKETPLMNRAK